MSLLLKLREDVKALVKESKEEFSLYIIKLEKKV
jgi:hypothetical protein